MDEDQWMYDTIIYEEVDMDDQNEQECGVKNGTQRVCSVPLFKGPIRERTN